MSIIRKPLFSFGLVADIQYADKENGSYEGRVQRYREAPAKLELAVENFNQDKDHLSFVLTLGDIIDGQPTPESSEKDLNLVLGLFEKLQVEPVYHLLGNHCLSLPRSLMIERLKIPERFYSVEIHDGWKLVILDSMDLSVRWPDGSPELLRGEMFLEEHPLSENEPQMSTWNGGIGDEQKSWLIEELKKAEMKKERVFVALHHPLVEGSAPPTHLLWNHKEISQILVDSPCVEVVFCGHYHVGGYNKVGSTHFVTIEAILEAQADSHAHAIVEVYKDEVKIIGKGSVTSRELPLA